MEQIITLSENGIRIYDNAEAQGLGRAAATGVLAPTTGPNFKWQWTRFDGGMNFFQTDAEAIAFLNRNYSDAVMEVR